MELAVAAAIIGAYGQYQAGKSQEKIYQAQAQQEEIKGRTEAIRSRAEGVKTLDAIRRTMSTINARGAAGAIDPMSGSAGSLQTYALREGYTEFDISQENAKLAAASAGFQANIYRASGSLARQAGKAQAISTVGQAGMSYFGAGGTDSKYSIFNPNSKFSVVG
jgi:hypothetical protein